jgi:hypothetical protein
VPGHRFIDRDVIFIIHDTHRNLCRKPPVHAR